MAVWLVSLSVNAQQKPPGVPSPTQPPVSSLPLDATNRAVRRRVEFPRPVAPPKPIEISVDLMTNTPLRLVEPGIFQLGQVRLDKAHRTVSFPAVLDRDQGPMEYLLVTTYGKTHESVLKTTAEPYHIHLAMLLIGAGANGTNALPGSIAQAAGGPVRNPSKEALPGDKVSIEVHWRANNQEIRHRAEELVFNGETRSVPDPGHWVYNGSLVSDGRFFAQMEGSVVSLITDPIALINNTGAGHDNDRIWTVNTNSLPPADVQVQVTLKLQDVQPKK